MVMWKPCNYRLDPNGILGDSWKLTAWSNRQSAGSAHRLSQTSHRSHNHSVPDGDGTRVHHQWWMLMMFDYVQDFRVTGLRPMGLLAWDGSGWTSDTYVIHVSPDRDLSIWVVHCFFTAINIMISSHAFARCVRVRIRLMSILRIFFAVA